MKWKETYNEIVKYVLDNKDKLNNLMVKDFVSHLSLKFDLSPITIRESYLRTMSFENIIEITEYGLVKIKK